MWLNLSRFFGSSSGIQPLQPASEHTKTGTHRVCAVRPQLETAVIRLGNYSFILVVNMLSGPHSSLSLGSSISILIYCQVVFVCLFMTEVKVTVFRALRLI